MDGRWKAWGGRWGWCSRADGLGAIRVVGQEIRTRIQRHAEQGLTLGEACQLAARIRDQRELIRHWADRRRPGELRRLLRLNRAHRRRLMDLARRLGIPTDALLVR